jgi:hypothetical protein
LKEWKEEWRRKEGMKGKDTEKEIKTGSKRTLEREGSKKKKEMTKKKQKKGMNK